MSTLHSQAPGEPAREPIAIVGVGCRYAGIENADKFWSVVSNGLETVGDYPGNRTPELDKFYERAGSPGGAITRRGGFIANLDQFDAEFFGISPREAVYLDPQQRFVLEAAYEAFEHAGYTRESLAGTKTSVFLGLWNNDYQAVTNTSAKHELFTLTGGSLFGGASRLCYFFDLQGAEFAVNAGCASSLISIHLACEALRSGDCTMAVAGGANAIVRKEASLSFSDAGALSADGRCKFGDSRANGFVRSEGAGIVALKRLSEAREQGDQVLAVILGTAVNSDGHSEGLWVRPSQSGQEKALRTALALSGLSGAQIDYVEAHGTGTASGDPAELNAISSVIGRAAGRERACLVGSVKTNIGHPESAGGVAGVIKTALALQHGFVPPTLNVVEPNPAIDWNASGIELALTRAAWPSSERPRHAVVSSFGLTGTNCDLVLGEAPSDIASAQKSARQPVEGAFLLPVTAQSRKALATLCVQFAEPVEQAEPETLKNICYTATRRRNHLAHRVAAVGRNASELGADLRRLAEQAAGSDATSGDAEAGAQPPIVFVFPGQGSQWIGMGRQLYGQLDAFRSAIDDCDPLIQAEAGWSLVEQLLDPEQVDRWEQIDVIQPALFAIEIALAAVWRSWGVEPTAVVGHSMGEVAAAYVAGVLSLEDAVRVICRRSRILLDARGKGAMAVVEATLAESERAINGYHDRLSVAVSNSSRSTVLSGDPDALTSVLEKLEGQGVFCRRIKVDVASHSPQMDPLTSALLANLRDIKPQRASIPFYSTVSGERMDGSGCDAAYWVRNLRQPVLFATATTQLLREGFSTFVEMSPHPILAPSVEQAFSDASQPGLALGSLRRDQDEMISLLTGLGVLFSAGYALRWEALYPAGELVALPRHLWNRKRFWIDGLDFPNSRADSDPLAHPLLGSAHESADKHWTWTAEIGADRPAWLKDHAVDGAVLLPASAYAEMAHAAGRTIFGSHPFAVEELSFTEALTIPSEGIVPVQVIAAPQANGRHRLRFFRKALDSAGEWVLFASGTLVKAAFAIEENKWDPAAEGMVAVSGDAHFRSMSSFGYQFGPAFQSLIGYAANADSARGEIRQPESVDADRYGLHPVLLDAAFQVAGALLLRKHKPSGPLLPVMLGRYRLLGSASRDDLLVATASLSGKDEFSANVMVTNSDGSLVAVVEDLRFQAIERHERDSLGPLLYQLTWTPLPAETASHQKPGMWLIVGGEDGLADRLAFALRAQGNAVAIWRAGEGYAIENLTDKTRPFRGLVYLCNLDRATDNSIDRVETDLAHAAQLVQFIDPILGDASVVFVTRGAVAVDAADRVNASQAPLWGFAAVLAKERPQTPCLCIDLDPATPDDLTIGALPLDALFARNETRFAIRKGKRYGSRLQPNAPGIQKPDLPARGVSSDERFEVHIQAKGVLDSLELRAHPRREPAEQEVEIEIVASALNFIDVASAMGLGQVTRDALGLECAGRVTRVGAGVTAVRVGDEVVAITPSYQSFGLLTSCATLPVELVWPKPARLSLAEAASFPSVFMTAYYGLIELARLRAGERVLIHSAAGGVGLAAIQIAKAKGAEIFATAGSEAKREYLRKLGVEHVMDSRSLDFGAEIQRITNGRGVDVVLNSLTGEAIREGLHALAPYGRFVEIGKLDIFENTEIGLKPFGKNLSLFALDLGKFFTERRAVLSEMMRELSTQFEQGVLHPLPVTAFPVSQAAAAFQYMAAAKHIGKVVLEMQDRDVRVKGIANPVRAQASYLITGGLGALGLTAAAELVDLGATHLVLTGRRKPSGSAEKQVEALRARGIDVGIALCDIAREEDVRGLLARFGNSMPPLRGVVHSAGALDDALIENLAPEHFASVMAGKARGAALLDQLTDDMELDFFVLFSSVAAVLGSVGQANYAAANAYLDALAYERVRRARPCTSINWGPWAEIGLAAAQTNRGDRLASQGLPSLSPVEGRLLFRRILEQRPTQVVATYFDAELWRQAFPSVGDAQFLSELSAKTPLAQAHRSVILEQLRTADPGAVQTMLADHVRQQLAAVLRLPIADVPVKRAFRTFGLDSLLGLELRNRLERSLGVKLPATVIWNYSTVEALSGHLVGRLNLQPVPSELSPAALLASELAAAESLLQRM